MTSIIRRTRHGVLLLPLALLLGACGSSSDKDTPQASPPPVATTPPSSIGDAFLNTIRSSFFALTDVEEPVPVEAIAATTPENTEPEPVQ